MILQSEAKAFDTAGKSVPICEFDTERSVVRSYNNNHMKQVLFENDLMNEEEIAVECCEYCFPMRAIRYHVHYVLEHNPEKLTRLVNENAIFDYLWKLEEKVLTALREQVERLKEGADDWKIAKAKGDFLQIAGIEKMLNMQAEEIVYPMLVYRA